MYTHYIGISSMRCISQDYSPMYFSFLPPHLKEEPVILRCPVIWSPRAETASFFSWCNVNRQAFKPISFGV